MYAEDASLTARNSVASLRTPEVVITVFENLRYNELTYLTLSMTEGKNRMKRRPWRRGGGV